MIWSTPRKRNMFNLPMPDFNCLVFLPTFAPSSSKPCSQFSSFTFFCKRKQIQIMMWTFDVDSKGVFISRTMKLTFATLATDVLEIDFVCFEILLIFEVGKIPSVSFFPERFFVLTGDDGFLPPFLLGLSPNFFEFLTLAIILCLQSHKNTYNQLHSERKIYSSVLCWIDCSWIFVFVPI